MKSPTYFAMNTKMNNSRFTANCTKPICFMCFVSKHKVHHCMDVNEDSQQFIKDLEQCYPQLNDCMSATQNELDEQNVNKEELLICAPTFQLKRNQNHLRRTSESDRITEQ